MAKFVSRRGEVGIAREITRGTAVAPAHWIPWASISFGDKVDYETEESAMGRIESSDDSFAMLKYGQGTIEADVRAAYLGLILTNLLGAAPTTTGSNPYTHTYTLTQSNTHTSLSLLAQDKTSTDINKMFPLTMIDKWSLKVEPGKIVTNSIDFIALSGRDYTSQTGAYTALGSKFLAQHLSFKVAANLAALTASTSINVKSLELSIEKNVMKNDVAGSVAPDDLNNQQFTVNGSLQLTYEDSTWLDYMTGETDRAMEIVLNAGTSATLTLRFPLVHFTNWAKDMPLNEIAKQTVDFTCHYDAPNATAMISTCTLVNAVTSY